jgi:hypothetical protein
MQTAGKAVQTRQTVPVLTKGACNATSSDNLPQRKNILFQSPSGFGNHCGRIIDSDAAAS